MLNDFFKKNNDSKKFYYIKGTALGVLATVIFMLIFAAVLLFFNIDRLYATPFATISIAIGGFVASFYTAKNIGDKGYLVGLIIGTVVFLVITLLSIIFGNGFSINTLFHFIIIILSSLVGGILGVNNKHKKYI